jgi:hypothetical protein
MLKKRFHIIYISVLLLIGIVVMQACSSKQSGTSLFSVLDSSKTGIAFANRLRPTPEFNLFSYMYYYNGAGVGAGDFNKDGLTDLFFAANQHANALYLNKGNLQFEDISAKAGIPQDSSWSTGVSVVDINNDGLLDIYVCKVGRYKVLKGSNQLLVCDSIDQQGIPHYRERAKEFGLDFSGFSTHAAFLDYDGDNDLDMFLLNHSVNHDGNYAPRDIFINTYDSLAGQRLYRNDIKKNELGQGQVYFTDVTKSSGINGSKIGYGLGVAVADINMDGWPDIYVGNDFHENDYLYINQQNGRFQEQNSQQLNHTSQFSMGVDVADVNNDAFPEIVSMDMLPDDPYMLRRSLAEDDYTIFQQKIFYGYTYQYARNNLQLNRRNGSFSEVGQFSGIHATDWSWAALWMDFNNDGDKDLFISNGIPKRMNDIDYINFVSGEDIQQKLRNNTIRDQDLSLTNKFPEIKIPNQFFLNKGDLHFSNLTDSIQKNPATFSNGAVYADLDNDGDLDIVTNNIGNAALVYQNSTNQAQQKASYTSLAFKGAPANTNAIGTKVLVYSKEKIRAYEHQPVHGFQSSMLTSLHIGLAHEPIDSAILIWPDQGYQRITLHPNKRDTIQYQAGLPRFDFRRLHAPPVSAIPLLKDITAETGFMYRHEENIFNEFNREALMPAMVSTEGPAVAVVDINHDGLEDVFAGASKGFPAAVFLQTVSGSFQRLSQPALQQDSMWEQIDAVWADINKDTHLDLLIATGGNEFYGNDEHQQPLLYLNDGKGKLTKVLNAFPDIYGTFSKVVVDDLNQDGYPDIFLAGRAEPWKYGVTPRSYLLLNNKQNGFRDVTATYSKDLLYPGMITDAHWVDLDQNGQKDLLLSAEWGVIDVYLREGKHFKKQSLTSLHGWWQTCTPVDMDGDGDLDIVAGNFGLNSRLKASEKERVKLYVNDFDDNGSAEQVMTYYLKGKEICFSSKTQLEKRMPALKKKFLYAADFAKASVEDIFGKKKLSTAQQRYADHFANTVFINQGKLSFEPMILPDAAQYSTLKAIVSIPSVKPTILLAGNFYEYNVEIGRMDADQGNYVQMKDGKPVVTQVPNRLLAGQVRKMLPITIKGKQAYVVVNNNGSWQILQQ